MAITLKGARANANLTLKQSAKLLGVTDRTLWMWEHGKSFPDIRKALLMEAVYGVDVHELIFLPNEYGITEDNETENTEETE